VTHRGLSSGFLVVSGHDEETLASTIAQLQPNGVTVVVLMGLARSMAIACRLIDRGWSRGTPAAVIVDASTRRQQVWRGTLDQLSAAPMATAAAAAGTIVIGDVVAVGLQDAQHENREQGAPANADIRKHEISLR
jgi:siroheme synthase